MSEISARDALQPSDRTAAGSLMAVGVETAGVRACLLEPVSGRHRLVGWMALRRGPDGSVSQPISTVVRRLGSRLGRTLWDDLREQPLLASDDKLRYPPLSHFLVGASPRPRLRVWLTGLSESVSLASARQATIAAPVQIVGETALAAGANGERLANQFRQAAPRSGRRDRRL
ncbi:MAG: hypothetical protein HC802_00285 [Caldilineaceae bacterium]|nr:hypothetical protein [Caldilineaceae bacterium]